MSVSTKSEAHETKKRLVNVAVVQAGLILFDPPVRKDI